MRAVVFVVLVLDSALLAVTELLFLPLRLGSWPFPVSVLVAAVATPWLVRRASVISARGLVAAAPLLTWLVVVFVVALTGPGGDAVLPGDAAATVPGWRALLLLAAGTLPAGLALGRILRRGG